MNSIDVAHQTTPDSSAAAGSPRGVPSGGRTAIRVLLVVIAAVAVLGTLAFLGVRATGLGSLRVLTDTKALPVGMRSLTIDSNGGDAIVRITADPDATAPRVDLRRVTQSSEAQLLVTNDAGGTRVTLGDGSPGFSPWKGHVSIKVILPPDVARGLSVTVNQPRGAVVTDANLDQLIANADEGDFTLGGAARRVDVKIHKGDIGTSAPIAVTESFRAVSESGEISVAFRAVPRTTEAIATGNVTVALPGPGPYRLRAQTEGAGSEPTVRVRETTDMGAPAVTAQSKAGSVLITETR